MTKKYQYNCVVSRVYDGDTVYLNIDLGFNIILMNRSIRIMGINTPEIRTKNKLEKTAGKIVAEFVKNLLPIGSECVLISYEHEGKFGRILGDILINGESLVDILKEHQYCYEYSGGKKEEFEVKFLENIVRLNT